MEQDNNKNNQLIDKYLAGMLSEEEELLFQQKLKEPEFKKELDQMQLLKVGITTFELRRVNDLLQKEEKQQHSNTQKDAVQDKSKQLIPILLKLAAILVGVSLVFWWFSLFNNKQQDYFTQYFTPQKNTLIVIDRSIPDSSLLKQTFSNYDNGEYEKALKGFDTLIAENDNDDYRFYQANTLLASNQTDQAILLLNQILQRNKSRFIEDSKWLLALSYLQKEQFNNARPLLEGITQAPFKSKAEVILQTLP